MCEKRKSLDLTLWQAEMIPTAALAELAVPVLVRMISMASVPVAPKINHREAMVPVATMTTTPQVERETQLLASSWRRLARFSATKACRRRVLRREVPLAATTIE
jgi:hypothetical protein